MNFQQILAGAPLVSTSGDPSLEISGINYDSRKVRPGEVFVAMHGESTDGNRYIEAAISQGAVAIVSDSAAEKLRPKVAWALVEHGRRALAVLSSNFYGHPAKQLRITGITGTNGKTTTAFLLEHILRFCGLGPVTLIGTIEYHYANQVVPALHTTPEALELNQILAKSIDQKLGKHASREGVMEVSSHALAQERVYGIPFDVAVFTNLTRDHLDFHGDMASYFAAKQRLFSGLGAAPPRAGVINLDDEHGRKLAELSRAQGTQVFGYGLEAGEFRATEVSSSAQGTRFTMKTPFGTVRLSSPLIGRVNVHNILAAAAAASLRGAMLELLSRAVGTFKNVPGRFERVDCGQPFTVVVDYAHTHDALRNLTVVARDLVGPAGRVIIAFGCGGDRDREKRPLMGEAAGTGSNFCVLTSDNPRSEDPMAIISETEPGLKRANARYSVEPDRRAAIAAAIAEAKPGDIVLIAGKGHEKVQISRDGAAHFDDVEVAREALQRQGYAAAPTGVAR